MKNFEREQAKSRTELKSEIIHILQGYIKNRKIRDDSKHGEIVNQKTFPLANLNDWFSKKK